MIGIPGGAGVKLPRFHHLMDSRLLPVIQAVNKHKIGDATATAPYRGGLPSLALLFNLHVKG